MLTSSFFLENLSVLSPDFQEQNFLLALSGGADSMVMAHLLIKNKIRFQAAHINYRLRGEDSEKDEELVTDFCARNNIILHTYRVSEEDKNAMHSVQLWARELRYRFFRELQRKENLDEIITAHHLNDQLETFIINLSKASGIAGLSGIPAHENQILRPLLPFSKNDIYTYAQKNKITFREDLSNQKNDYLRNRIRHRVVPELLTTHDDFLENFRHSLEYLQEAKKFISEKIQETENLLTKKKDGHIIISKPALFAESDFAQYEILKKYGFHRKSEIKKMFSAATGSFFYSDTHQLLINRDQLLIQPKCAEEKYSTEDIILLENLPENGKDIFINLEDFDIELHQDLRWIYDAEKLIFPLKLRRKQTGDLFFPTNFDGKKKVSKFFKDEKLSILAKQKTWLLADGKNHVLGILPFRQDRRFAEDEYSQYRLIIFYENTHRI